MFPDGDLIIHFITVIAVSLFSPPISTFISAGCGFRKARGGRGGKGGEKGKEREKKARRKGRGKGREEREGGKGKGREGGGREREVW